MAFPICLIVAFFNNKFTIQIFRNVQNFSITDCVNVFCIRIYFAFFLHLIKLLFVIKVSRHHINKIIKFRHVFYLHKFRFIEPSIPYFSIKGYPCMKNVDVLPHIGSTRILRGRSLLAHQTLLARSSGLYLYDRKIRKNPNPFPIWKIGFGLYWFGAVDGTGFSRLDAVRSAPLSGHTVA